MKRQRGLGLIGVLLILGALIITVGGAVALPAVRQVWDSKTAGTERPPVEASPTPSLSPEQEGFAQQQPLLRILPPEERAELEEAIRETQRILQNIEIFNFSLPTAEDIKKGLGQTNKQAPQQTPTIPPVDIQKIEEYFKQNPPAVPYGGKEFSPAEKEYYYRKNVLEDPAFQW